MSTNNRTLSKERLEEVAALFTELDARLEAHNENRKEVQRSLHSQCEEMRKQIDELEEHVNNDFETQFMEEKPASRESRLLFRRLQDRAPKRTWTKLYNTQKQSSL